MAQLDMDGPVEGPGASGPQVGGILGLGDTGSSPLASGRVSNKPLLC